MCVWRGVIVVNSVILAANKHGVGLDLPYHFQYRAVAGLSGSVFLLRKFFRRDDAVAGD